MRKIVLTATLNPSLDEFLLFNGSSKKPYKQIYSAGGKGVNVSRTLSKLGAKTISIGFIGGEAGEKIKKLMDGEKLSYDFIDIRGETRVNTSYIFENKKRNKRVVNKGPKVLLKELLAFKKLFRAYLPKCSCVVISGSNARGAASHFYADLILMAKERNIPVILDTSSYALKCSISSSPFLIKPNKKEAEEILEYSLKSRKSQIKASEDMKLRGAERALISLGKDGLVFYGEGMMCRVAPPKIKVFNDVGCGDALVGGFVFNYILKGHTLGDTLISSSAIASASSLTLIPGQFLVKDYRKLLKEIQLHQI